MIKLYSVSQPRDSLGIRRMCIKTRRIVFLYTRQLVFVDASKRINLQGGMEKKRSHDNWFFNLRQWNKRNNEGTSEEQF